MTDSKTGTPNQSSRSSGRVPHTEPSPLEKERLFSSARNSTQQWTRKNLSHYLEQLDEKLFKMADKAGSNEDQNRYFQARDEIGRSRETIESTFLAQVQLAFSHYQQGKNTCTDFSHELSNKNASTDDVREEDLALVDNRELEEKLAIASMSRRRLADNAEQLYALNQRFSALRENTKITDYSNPLAPGVFAEALQTAIEELTLDETARLLVYKVFDNCLMAALGRFYDQLNTHFKSNGLLPNLGYYVKKSAEDILADLPEELKHQLSEVSVNRQLDLINAIQLIQQRLSAHRQPTRPPNVPALSAQELFRGMQQVQLDASVLLDKLETQQALASNNTATLRKQVEEQIQRTDDIDKNVIEIVGLLFEYMLNDEQLPDSVKTLLSYLHTPFLKIALLEKDFFNHPEHPARQLLNSLVAAGERWVEPNGRRKSEVFEKIRKIVQRVLQEFDNDIRLFSELAFEFNSYLRQHARRIRQLEKRARQAAEGENKLKEIRQKIDQFIKKKIGTQQLPSNIKNLLFEPWANFLSFNVLRYGPRSEQWREAARVVEDIVWYCQPHNTETDSHARARLEELRHALPTVLQSGFDTVGYDNIQGQRLIRSLQQREQLIAARKPAVALNAEKSAATDTPPGQQTVTNDSVLNGLKQLKADTWFEFNASSEEPQRVKLVWSSENTAQFMFVNRLGQQVAVKSGTQLADEIRSGQTRQLPELVDKPFFEKAMERALDQLKQRASATSA